MNMGITKSVGRYGINLHSDVVFIQTALNAYAKKHAKNTFPLKVDGLCGDKTIQAIFNFQRNHLGISTPDARIDPNSRSFRQLTTNAPQACAAPVQRANKVDTIKSMQEKIESLLKEAKTPLNNRTALKTHNPNALFHK